MVLAGCRSTIKPEGAAGSVTDLESNKTGFKPTNVKCPSDVDAGVGKEFEFTQRSRGAGIHRPNEGHQGRGRQRRILHQDRSELGAASCARRTATALTYRRVDNRLAVVVAVRRYATRRDLVRRRQSGAVDGAEHRESRRQLQILVHQEELRLPLVPGPELAMRRRASEGRPPGSSTRVGGPGPGWWGPRSGTGGPARRFRCRSDHRTATARRVRSRWLNRCGTWCCRSTLLGQAREVVHRARRPAVVQLQPDAALIGGDARADEGRIGGGPAVLRRLGRTCSPARSSPGTGSWTPTSSAVRTAAARCRWR